jgi:hypothetical protein
LEREVSGTHVAAGGRLRVDAVIEAPDPDGWRTPRWALEMKKPQLGSDASDHAALVVQAADYRYVAWDGYGHLPVMVWPEPFATHLDGATHATRAILSRMRTPPLRWVSGHGWWLGLNLTRMWSQAKGPSAHAANWDLTPTWEAQ